MKGNSMSEAILPGITDTGRTGREQAWTPAKVIYTVLMAFNLLSHLWLFAVGSGVEVNPVIWMTRLITVPFAVCLGKLWKDRGFRILVIYTLLFTLRSFIPDPDSLFNQELAENVLSALWLAGGCYGLGRVLNTRQLKRFLVICAFVWIVGMAVFSSIGIYAAWNDIRIRSIFNRRRFFGLYKSRLMIMYLSSTSGLFLSITALMTILITLCTRNRCCKVLLLVLLTPVFLAMVLTDSRTAYISVAAGLGIMVFSIVYQHCQQRSKHSARSSQWKLLLFCIFIMLIVFALALFLIMQVTPLYNQIRNHGLIPAAYAEGNEEAIISNRGFDGTSSEVLTGRLELWTDIINYIIRNPSTLIMGRSKISPLKDISSNMAHCHNVYLQVLLESGIPGLLLMLCFIGYTLTRGFRVIRSLEHPLWIRLLPAIPVVLWLGDIVEVFTWFRTSHCPMITVLFITAGILSAHAPGKAKPVPDRRDPEQTILSGSISQTDEKGSVET